MGVSRVNCALKETVKSGIIDLARQCNLDKVILFGSRVRGTVRERSNIDLSIRGGDTVTFAASVEEDIPTHLFFDVVDMDKPVRPELLEEIGKDGVVIYEEKEYFPKESDCIRFSYGKYENFYKALDNLQLVRDVKGPYDVLTLTGSAALFEICFEQAWKAMKDILREHGYGECQTGSPRRILKLAYSAGMIQDEKGWPAMLVSKNDVTHSYKEEVALALVKRVKEDYINLLKELNAELESNWL